MSYLEDDEELAYSLKCLNTSYTDNFFSLSLRGICS